MAEKFHDFALALSGGGVRGFVHAGILKALDEARLKPAALSGASMGALIGALYASGVKPESMIDLLHRPEWTSLPGWIGFKGGFGTLDLLRTQLQEHIHAELFEDLTIPLTVSVTNLNKACNELISTGPLMPWLIASSSVPVVFNPVMINNQYYVDGGLTVNMPARCLEKPGRMIIGINSVHMEEVDKAFTTIKSVAERCLFIAVQNTVRDQLETCHLIVDPPECRAYGTFEFDKAKEIFDVGYTYGKSLVSEIRSKIRK